MTIKISSNFSIFILFLDLVFWVSKNPDCYFKGHFMFKISTFYKKVKVKAKIRIDRHWCAVVVLGGGGGV
jgi:hypothetical protein